ncbi:unnamed protein product, partial [Rotaria sordida]
MQIDLIDMRTAEHNGFKWIFHAKDYFSKYSWLYPLVTKEAINVAETLKSIFYQFGPPRILQSDNGREFVAKVILALTKLWPGLLIINGRPRHPQSQGLVERGNAVVQQLLGTCVARTINQTPFEVVFGQQPRTDDYTWKCIETHLKTNQPIEPSHVILEEDLPDDIFDMIKQVDEIEGPPIDPQTNNSNEEPTCTNVASTTNTNDQQPQNNKEEIRSDFNIDHEELVDSTTCLSNVLESKAASIAVNRHKRIRENTEECYLNNAHSQLTKYISKSSKRQRTYHVGDIIGLKVSDVDRTNTSSTILPCKIVDSKDQDGEVFCNVATMN